MPLNFVIYCHG